MDNKSISHTRWKCQYHIVFIPQYRKKVLYGKVREDVREILNTLCKYKNVEIIAGAVCVDHVHLSVAIPPKLSVSDFIYYGATSIMMCQVDGLICDISNYTDENGLICSEDDEKEICELYQIDFQNHKKFAKTSEKHMILRLAAMTENAVFYWEAMTDYIYNVVLTSHGEEYRDHNPLRNKICHGDQLDFGTEEKSLKSIFVIDLLLNLKSEMQWLAEHKFDK